MGRQEKREQRIRENPKAVRVAELIAVLESAGFDCREGNRGHWTCSHPSGEWCNIPTPHGRGDKYVLAIYVRRALAALDAVRDLED